MGLFSHYFYCRSKPQSRPVKHFFYFFLQSLTREFTPPKPDPAPLLHICRDWGVHPKNVVMVGDHLHDIQCGKSAGSGQQMCFLLLKLLESSGVLIKPVTGSLCSLRMPSTSYCHMRFV